jgi:hypothetical protein
MSAGYMRRCARKKRYGDKPEASKAKGALAGNTGASVNVYRCDQCLGWHVGKADGAFISRNRTGKRPNKRMRGRV